MGIFRATKYKTLLKLSAAVFVVCSIMLINIPPLNANAVVSTGDGRIEVTLNKNPASAATITAKRAADAITPEGKSIPAETVKLTLVSKTKGDYTVYESPLLAYSGYKNNPTGCHDTGEAYYDWNVTVSGSAIGSGKVRVACGGVVNLNIAVTLAGAKDPNGTIVGTASYQGTNCNTSSYYQLLSPDASPDFSKNSTSLQIDGTTGKYTISAKPGTYQLAILCYYSPNNANIPDQTTLTKQPVIVVANTTTTVNFASTSTDSTTVNSCQDSNIALGWIMCELITGLTNAVDGIYNNVISPMLQEDTSNTNPALETAKAAWSGFRVYADIFLVFALLAVVFGQSIGGGLIDAYAAKKILPRLLLAVILINLSFYLVKLMLDITNVVGGGIVDLITRPFGSGASSFALNIKINTAGQVVTLGAISAGVYAAFAGGMAFLGWVWPFVLLPALLSLIATFIVILIRRGLIILLIIFSPVAFALYVLPNTAKYFKQWWDLLFKTLLVYPIIMVLMALSQVMAVAVSSGGGSGISPAVAGILSVVALVLPLFLIPFAFKISGGIIGQASQAMQGLSKQAHKRMLGDPKDPNSMGRKAKDNLASKYAEKNMSGAAIGARFNPKTMFGDNRRDALAKIRTTKMRTHAAQAASTEMMAANANDSMHLLALANRDLALERLDYANKNLGTLESQLATAQTTGASQGEIQNIKNKILGTKAEIVARRGGLASANLVHGKELASTRLAAFDALTKSGYEFSSGEKGYNEIVTMVDSLAGGNATTRSQLMNDAQYNLKNAGQFGFGGINNGAYYDFEAGSDKGNSYQKGSAGKKEYFISGAENYFGKNAFDPVTGKLSKYLAATEAKSRIAADPNESERLGAWYADLAGQYPGATEGNKKEIRAQMDIIEAAIRPVGTGFSIPSMGVTDDNPAPVTYESEGQKILADKVRSTLAAQRGNGMDPNILNDIDKQK